MNNPIREIIKSNLQKLSKEELIDTLVDIFMTLSTFSIANAVCSIQCETSPISSYVQRVNNKFANIQQQLSELEK